MFFQLWLEQAENLLLEVDDFSPLLAEVSHYYNHPLVVINLICKEYAYLIRKTSFKYVSHWVGKSYVYV